MKLKINITNKYFLPYRQSALIGDVECIKFRVINITENI